MKVKLTLEYNGLAFCGFQTQDNLLTVQGELERALTLYLGSISKRSSVEIPGRITVTGSGRTDAGVHAKGQVVSFHWPETLAFNAKRLVEALNGITTRALVIRHAQEATESFDARLSPHVKCYCYSLLLRNTSGFYEGRCWPVGEQLDIRTMIAAAKHLVGQHDFSSFRARDCTAQSTVRTLLLSELFRSSRDRLQYTVYGKGFLKQMIRIIVGTLVEIGRGRMTIKDFEGLLLAGDRSRAGPTAPAKGLVLEWVKYDEKALETG